MGMTDRANMCCKDCLHYEACREMLRAFDCPVPGDDGGLGVEKSCNTFKDRTRFVELPCKVGDTVYVINRHLNKIFECTVISLGVGRGSDLKNYLKTKWVGSNGNESIRKWSFRQFGRYVFPTYEEAEAALAEGGERECEQWLTEKR